MAPDAFGKAFLAYFEGKKPDMVIEREDGYLDSDDMGSYFCEYKDFPECEKRALEHAKGRVLDIGMGAGRIAVHLQDKGHEVVGIDLSRIALDVAAKRGVLKGLMMSACDLEFGDGSFDTAIAFGNNFGLCGTPTGVIGMLVRLRKILSDDGVILAESINPVATNNPDHLRYQKENVDRGRMPGQITIRFKFDGLVSGWFDLLIVTPGQMAELCAKADWKVEATYPSGPDLSKANMYTAVLKKA